MADAEPEQVWEGETPLGAKVMLATAPHLGNGLMFSTRMTDPDDPRWFSVYLPLTTVDEICGSMLGFHLRQIFTGKGVGDD